MRLDIEVSEEKKVNAMGISLKGMGSSNKKVYSAFGASRYGLRFRRNNGLW